MNGVEKARVKHQRKKTISNVRVYIRFPNHFNFVRALHIKYYTLAFPIYNGSHTLICVRKKSCFIILVWRSFFSFTQIRVSTNDDEMWLTLERKKNIDCTHYSSCDFFSMSFCYVVDNSWNILKPHMLFRIDVQINQNLALNIKFDCIDLGGGGITSILSLRKLHLTFHILKTRKCDRSICSLNMFAN